MAIKRANPRLSFGLLALFIDGSIILLSIFVYKDLLAFLFGLVYTVVTSVMIDLTCKLISRYFPKWKAASVS